MPNKLPKIKGTKKIEIETPGRKVDTSVHINNHRKKKGNDIEPHKVKRIGVKEPLIDKELRKKISKQRNRITSFVKRYEKLGFKFDLDPYTQTILNTKKTTKPYINVQTLHHLENLTAFELRKIGYKMDVNTKLPMYNIDDHLKMVRQLAGRQAADTRKYWKEAQQWAEEHSMSYDDLMDAMTYGMSDEVRAELDEEEYQKFVEMQNDAEFKMLYGITDEALEDLEQREYEEALNAMLEQRDKDIEDMHKGKYMGSADQLDEGQLLIENLMATLSGKAHTSLGEHLANELIAELSKYTENYGVLAELNKYAEELNECAEIIMLASDIPLVQDRYDKAMGYINNALAVSSGTEEFKNTFSLLYADAPTDLYDLPMQVSDDTYYSKFDNGYEDDNKMLDKYFKEFYGNKE